MKIAVLTGGGDCPGLNAVIRAVFRSSNRIPDAGVIGFLHGWAGAIHGETMPLDRETTRGILHRGGTILGTSRTNPYAETSAEHAVEMILTNLSELSVDALIAIGGEDTLGVAHRLFEQEAVPVVGIPKTIDNDLAATDYTFGFQTAVQTATEAIDRLHTTAESHNRVMVVEVMGRHAGWIAVYAGMAGGADAILIPERPFDIDEVVRHIKHRHELGRLFSIVVVAEGATAVGGTTHLVAEEDEFGHPRLGGIGNWLQVELEKRTGYETRTTILGHVQRGGTPIAFDRVLASRFGVEAVGAVADRDFGKMVALRGTRIERVGLDEAVAHPKTVDPELMSVAEVFLG